MNLDEMLARRGTKTVALTGGGGKTTLTLALARRSAAAGRKTLIYTTTHMGVSQVEDIPRHWQPGLPRFAGELASDTRLGPPSEDELAGLLPQAEAVFVEADGAKRLPVKYPAAWEPVIPTGATVLTVAGLSALGQPFDQVCFRWELARAALGYHGALLDEATLAALIAAGYGGFQPVVALNQADTAERQKAGERVANLLSSYNIMEVCLTKWGASC